MITYYAKRSAGELFNKLDTPISSGMWVDAANASDKELDGLVEAYDLDKNVVYDVRDHAELPRVELSDEVAYTFLRLPRLAKSGHVTALPVLCVIKRGLFITMSIGDSIAPESVALTTLPVTTEQSDTLLLGVIASVVASFEALILHTERSITDTANRLRTHEITNRDFIHFVTVEANLNSCQMNLESTLAMTHRLRENRHDTLSSDGIEALDDIALHIQQLLVSITSHAQSVESIRNAYSTIANNSLNLRMKTLTVFTVLITLPNVLYGMYGMNVPLPYQDQAWAYPTVIAISVALVGIVYIVAKRLRIL